MHMQDAELAAAYRQAKDPAAQIGILADLNCVSKGAMARKLQDLGLLGAVAPLAKPSKAPFDTERAMELHAAGKDDLQIAEQLGIAKTTFSTWRRKQGLKINGYKSPQADKPEPSEAPALSKTLPANSGAMTAQQVSVIFQSIAEWHPDAVVKIGGTAPLRKILLVSEYQVSAEPVLEIRVD